MMPVLIIPLITIGVRRRPRKSHQIRNSLPSVLGNRQIQCLQVPYLLVPPSFFPMVSVRTSEAVRKAYFWNC